MDESWTLSLTFPPPAPHSVSPRAHIPVVTRTYGVLVLGLLFSLFVLLCLQCHALFHISIGFCSAAAIFELLSLSLVFCLFQPLPRTATKDESVYIPCVL